MLTVRGAASLACVAALLMVVGSVPSPGTRIQAAGAQSPSPTPASTLPPSPRAVLDKYCVTCHNARLRTADLQLDAVDVERPAIVTAFRVFDLYQGRNLPKGKKSVAFRVVMQDTARTLTDAEADAAREAIIGLLGRRFGTELRS